MWIEYINRLVGVAVGIFILGTFILSLPYRRSDPAVMWGALAAFLLVGFQGWLGGKVVESNLRGGMVTIHMAVAVVLLSLLIWVAYRSAGDAGRIAILGGGRRRLRATVGVLFFLSVIQVLLGARVREDVDEIAGAGGPLERPEWLGAVGEVFVIHRTFAWALVAATVVVLWSARRGGLSGWGKYAVWTVGVVIAGQVISGAALAYFGLPPAFQVVHLGLSTVLCSLCYLVWIALRPGAPVPVSGAGRWLDADGQPRSTA
jgi:cytochrome c oxidase assembly protein subunit 15